MRIGLGLLLVATLSTAAWPQNASQSGRFRESVTLDSDNTIIKQLGTVQDYLGQEQWAEGIGLLRQVSEAHGQSLISVSPGRYVNVANYCNLMLAGLGPTGLAAYRETADPQARQWFEQGVRGHDATLLKKVVQEAFASSYGDDALWLLAEWAWDAGRLTDARKYWESLLPDPQPPAPGEPLLLLAFPDSQYDAAAIRARLVLCSVLENNPERARREFNIFRQLHGSAEGSLAGQTGKLAAILEQVLRDAGNWAVAPPSPTAASFGFNVQRNKVLPQKVDIGGVRWRIPLRPNRFKTAKPRSALHDHGPLSYFPVTYGDILLFNDADTIYAFDVRTGRPAWPVDDDDSGAIYPALPGEKTQLLKTTAGVPYYTSTVHNGRLYARMGPPVVARARHDLRVESYLVCLDLNAEGKPLWIYLADEIDGGGKRRDVIGFRDVDLGGDAWCFDGSPVVDSGRLYVTLRRSHPNTQFNLACLHAATGELVWNHKMCAALANIDDSKNYLGHSLLTLADQTLFYSTGSGAVVAVNAVDGRLRWVSTYASQARPSDSELSDHSRQQVSACLYHQGTIVAAPADSDRVMAIDSNTGVLRWSRRLGDRILHLLGVGRNRLVISGRRLWGLDIDNGRIVWRLPASMGASYGRGLLVEDEVYWPTHEQIVVVKQTSGQLSRQPISLSRAHHERGGNLLISGGLLLIAQPQQLVAFGEKPGPSRLQFLEVTSRWRRGGRVDR